MKVKDVMQKEITTLGLEDWLDVADGVMRLGRVRHLPVVNDAGVLVGLVSHRDLLKASVASVLQFSAETERDWLRNIQVRTVMTTNVTTIDPDADLVAAIDLMVTQKFGCLPVVTGGKLVGLLTETDCLRELRDILGRAEPLHLAARGS
jgi:CBS domain-containing membrane protein